MSKADVEAMIRTLPADEQRRARRFYNEHAWSYCNLLGEHVPHPYEKHNVIEDLFSRERFVVDNTSISKSSWRGVRHKDKAFIITPPLSWVQPHTKSFLKDICGHNNNVFLVGITKDETHNKTLMQFDVLDEVYMLAFNDVLLTEASMGKGEILQRQKHDRRINNEVWKFDILSFLGVQAVEDIPRELNDRWVAVKE